MCLVKLPLTGVLYGQLGHCSQEDEDEGDNNEDAVAAESWK